jgi:hypothetical protein
MSFGKPSNWLTVRGPAAFLLAVLWLLLAGAVPLSGQETNAMVEATVSDTNAVPSVVEPAPESGASQAKIRAVIVRLGPGMVFLLLSIFNVFQMVKSKSPLETAAKVLVNCLGFVLMFWIESTFNVKPSSRICESLTSPMPVTAYAQMWYGVVAAVGMFAFLFLLEALGDLTAGRNSMQAVTVFISCVMLYLLYPLLKPLQEAARVAETRLFHISTGILIGGMLYLIFLLFDLGKRKPKAGAPKPQV